VSRRVTVHEITAGKPLLEAGLRVWLDGVDWAFRFAYAAIDAIRPGG